MKKHFPLIFLFFSLVECYSNATMGKEFYSFRIGNNYIQLGEPATKSFVATSTAQKEYYDSSRKIDVIELNMGTNSVLIDKKTQTIMRVVAREKPWELNVGIRVGDGVEIVKQKIKGAIIGQKHIIFNASSYYYMVLNGRTYIYDLRMDVTNDTVVAIELSLGLNVD